MSNRARGERRTDGSGFTTTPHLVGKLLAPADPARATEYAKLALAYYTAEAAQKKPGADETLAEIKAWLERRG